MATGKDKVDAFAFARRRMVANLIVPGPTGSDLGAPRPVRAFVTSAILSVMAVAGVAVLGAFKPGAPSGWQNGLAVDSSSGAAYVYSTQDKELHPVVNITSAKLLLGKNFTKYDVPDSVINGPGVTIGAPFGILGAPTDVPAAANVDLTQWNICVQEKNAADQTQPGGKTVLEVGYGRGQDAAVPASDGFIVHDSSNKSYLIDGGYAYEFSDPDAIKVFAAPPAAGVGAGPWVSDSWLEAFQKGGDIGFPTVAGMGQPAVSPLPQHADVEIGDYGSLTVNGQLQGYIETEDGLVQVNPFVYKLYSGSPAVEQAHQLTLTQAQIDGAKVLPETTDASSLGGTAANWPLAVPGVLDPGGDTSGFGVLCASYDGHFYADSDAAQLSLYYGSALPHPLASGEGVPVAEGPLFPDVVDVLPGHAALIRSVTGGLSQNSGTEYLVPGTGVKYVMTPSATIVQPNGQSAQVSAVGQLQYSGVAVEPVPQAWTKLLETGAPLDPTEAGKTPELGSAQ